MLQLTPPQMFHTKFQFIWPSGFRREHFQKSTNQKQELPIAAMTFTDRDEISNLYRGPSRDASYQDTVHLAKRLQNIIYFFQKLTIQKQELPMAAMFVNGSGRNEQFFRGSSINASYQVSVHLVIRFQRRRFKCEKLTDDGRRTPIDGKRSCGISAR